jgi:hypothetical protein
MKLLLTAIVCLCVNFVQSEEYECQAIGRFPDRSSPDCSGYHVCIFTQFGLTAVTTACPSQMKYDWDLNVCVPERFFICPNTVNPAAFICPGQGNYPDENSLDCGQFYYCHDEGMEPMEVSCPQNSIFDWQFSRCVRNHYLGCPASSPAYTCPRVGLWLNHASVSTGCNSYFNCFESFDGTVRHTIMYCPDGEAFDFVRKSCLPINVASCPRWGVCWFRVIDYLKIKKVYILL